MCSWIHRFSGRKEGLSLAAIFGCGVQYGSPYPTGANSEDVMYFTTDGTDLASNTVVCITAIPNASNLLQVRRQTCIFPFGFFK